MSCIERVLIKTGNANDLVAKKLDTFYSCTINDCYERPEYLRTALRYVYRDDYRSLLEKIKLELCDLVSETHISKFIKTLESSLENEPLLKCAKCDYVFVPEPADNMGHYVMGYAGCPKCHTVGLSYRVSKH